MAAPRLRVVVELELPFFGLRREPRPLPLVRLFPHVRLFRCFLQIQTEICQERNEKMKKSASFSKKGVALLVRSNCLRLELTLRCGSNKLL